ncbi:MAG TPA: haloacid dehalogenase type II [Rhodospirillales bacterium]
MSNAADGVKALVFDVFGTVVDWRSAILAEGAALARAKGLAVDWPAFIRAWESGRRAAMDKVNAGAPWINLSAIYRRLLDETLAAFGVVGLTEAEKDQFNHARCRPNVWPDSLPALKRLRARYTLATLTNNDYAWAVAMAKHASLPWDAVITSELFRRYKPAPETYRGALALLAVEPAQAMMVACHNYDLRAARSHGMRTAFIPRKEFSDDQTKDQAAEDDWDVVDDDLSGVADRLGA